MTIETACMSPHTTPPPEIRGPPICSASTATLTEKLIGSSGMVALHQAIQSLRTYEADLSIVGGANLTLNPDMFKALGSSG